MSSLLLDFFNCKIAKQWNAGLQNCHNWTKYPAHIISKVCFLFIKLKLHKKQIYLAIISSNTGIPKNVMLLPLQLLIWRLIFPIEWDLMVATQIWRLPRVGEHLQMYTIIALSHTCNIEAYNFSEPPMLALLPSIISFVINNSHPYLVTIVIVALKAWPQYNFVPQNEYCICP